MIADLHTHLQQTPNGQLGIRVLAQDYEKLRRQALANDNLFEDPYFPADDSSLFYTQKLPFKPEWKRPGVRWLCGKCISYFLMPYAGCHMQVKIALKQYCAWKAMDYPI